MDTGRVMACRLARPADRPALLALWEQVFGDGPGFAGRCLDSFAGPGNVYVAEDNDGLAAMLLAAPCGLEGRAGIYLYALATRPRQRGAGIMTALMAYAEREKAVLGAAFAALIPASRPLFDYYRKRGYSQDINLGHITLDHVISAPNNIRVETPSRDTLQVLRAQWMDVKQIGFPEEQSDFIADDLAQAGWRLVVAADGYAVFAQAEKGLLVAELGAADTRRAEALLAAVLRHTGETAVHVTLPEASPLYAGCGTMRPAALLKPLAPGFAVDRPYLRFALDEVSGGFEP